MTDSPIADYALLSDRHGSALVDRSGSIDWLCLKAFDSPSLFGRILDDSAGHWSIQPAGKIVSTTRTYVEGSMVLETTVQTATGVIVLTDALLLNRRIKGHSLGVGAPHVLARRVECIKGEMEIIVEFAPRPEYGLVAPLVVASSGGLVASGGAQILTLSSAKPFTCDESQGIGVSRFALKEGDSTSFALSHHTMGETPVKTLTQRAIKHALGRTIKAWQSWTKLHQSYEGPWKELVHHSGRVLEALSYQPTGAIIAAPTTSLPEQIGGSRNWDYRYAWIRDTSFTLEALWVAACPEEAGNFFNFLTGASARQLTNGDDLQIMYGIDGRHDLSERNLGHLSGYRKSAPVRVGNGAWDQCQLDVYGELLAAAYRLSEQLGDMPEATREFLRSAADAAMFRWEQPDQSIWETRGGAQHYVYSKLMCWVALDRAVKMAPQLGAEASVAKWSDAAEKIKQAILDRGWNDEIGAFTQCFDSDELDASSLVIPIVGLLPADDKRVLGTIDAIQSSLTDKHGYVYRYASADGQEGKEGTFLLCTFWLAQCLAMIGQVDQATATFERAIDLINDVGLLSEEVDADAREMLGNFPQAFSHIGLINAAWAISEAKEQRSPR